MNNLIQFDAAFFSANRAKLREQFGGNAPIVITGHGLMQSSSDCNYPFRQNSYFWYLTGVDKPDVILVMDRGGRDYLIVNQYSESHEAFNGTLSHAQLMASSGVGEVLLAKDGFRRLDKRLKKASTAGVLMSAPAFNEHNQSYTNPSSQALIDKIKVWNPIIELIDVKPFLARLRMSKTLAELDAISKAINITNEVILGIFKPLAKSKITTEKQLAHELLNKAVQAGASGWGFDPVVSSGKNSCIFHYIESDSKIPEQGIIQLDIGVAVGLYTSDISRPIFMCRPTRRQKQVWEAVVDVWDYAATLLKPGVMMQTYEQQVEHYMGEKLRELGLIKIIDHESVRKYFPHATSHFLGLDVHDAADYRLPLEVGMILTIELGIYIPEENFGLRLEDDVIITPSGCSILGNRLPVKTDELTINKIS